MAIRQVIWKSLYLNLTAGVILCASLGCKNTRGDTGPNLNAPVKTAMGPGNQLQVSTTPPAYKNLPANALPNSAMQNSGLSNQGNPNSAMQGVQLPPMNRDVNPSFNAGQQNPVVVPSQYPKDPRINHVPAQTNPNLGQPNHLPPQLNQNLGPSLMPMQGGPTSMKQEDLRIPNLDSPVDPREAASANGPTLMPASQNQINLTLDPAVKEWKEPSVKEIAEMRGGKRMQPSTPVEVTPIEPQPTTLQAPITTIAPMK